MVDLLRRAAIRKGGGKRTMLSPPERIEEEKREIAAFFANISQPRGKKVRGKKRGGDPCYNLFIID